MNATNAKAEITFESRDGKDIGPMLTVRGASPEILKQGDKIRQIMDILDLPKGTNARLVYEAGDVIVR
jgi:hypothetical protein